MRIISSDVSLSSSRIDVKHSSKFEYLRKWDQDSELIQSSIEENGEIAMESHQKRDRVELSTPSLIQSQEGKKLSEQSEADKPSIKEMIDEIWGDLRTRIIKDLVEIFTGKKIEVLDAEEFKELQESASSGEVAKKLENLKGFFSIPINSQGNVAEPPSSRLQGWGVDYYYKETHYQKEGFEFLASGNITNDKGQQISFDASLLMSREKYEELTVSIKEGDALIDPLVINFNGTGASFGDAKFEFDLDADGKTEMIHAPSTGTAFLAYDKNGNGVIDDGSELFGPSTGNGFSELAALDEDNNGWIDENDSVFSKLRLWEKTSDGNDSVSSLLDRGVGAIYTGRVATGFDLISNDEVSAVVKETGVFLKENGASGFIQEVDIVV